MDFRNYSNSVHVGRLTVYLATVRALRWLQHDARIRLWLWNAEDGLQLRYDESLWNVLHVADTAGNIDIDRVGDWLVNQAVDGKITITL